jgi:hypothetical protein
MPRAGCWLILFALGSWPGTPSLAQTLTDPAALRFSHTVESRRAEVLEEYRREAAQRLVTVAGEVLTLPEGSGTRKTELLGEAQYLADSIALLDQEIEEAIPAAREARRGLIRALEGQAATLRQALQDADPQRRPSLEARLRELEAELGPLHELEGEPPAAHPLSPHSTTLTALTHMAAGELTRLRNLRTLQDELRLYMGNLRLFDETGMPPSLRAQTGGDPDPGGTCPIGCPVTEPPPAPADLPLDHFRPEGPRDREDAVAMPVTPASLRRLREQLASYVGSPEVPTTTAAGEEMEPPREDQGGVTRDTQIGVTFMGFRGGGGGGGRSGVGLRIGTSALFTRPLGRAVHLTVEPWFGARSVQLDVASASEAAGELRGTLTGSLRAGHLRWQLTSWQKGRFLSDPLPLPAYLEPGRREGGLAGRAALTLHPGWDLEMVGGGDLVRYGPEDWKVLDRQGFNGSVGLAHQGESGFARLSVMGSHHQFVAGDGLPREDTRVGVGADWSTEGRVVLRLSAGVAWNDSRIPAYDARSGRAALVVSAPWRGGSIQGYGSLAHQRYANPGPEDERVAPSDEDRGSVVALQLTRPMDATHNLTLRAEWSRSESGFRDDFFQRFGLSFHVSFRSLGGA